eukprot:scaffold235171_cov17-Tisochrysis_lutea.AAC.2
MPGAQWLGCQGTPCLGCERPGMQCLGHNAWQVKGCTARIVMPAQRVPQHALRSWPYGPHVEQLPA